jgi:hypothetical protein
VLGRKVCKPACAPKLKALASSKSAVFKLVDGGRSIKLLPTGRQVAAAVAAAATTKACSQQQPSLTSFQCHGVYTCTTKCRRIMLTINK